MFSALSKAPMHTLRCTSRFQASPRFYSTGTRPITAKCGVNAEIHACSMGIFLPSLPVTEGIDQTELPNKIKASLYSDSPIPPPRINMGKEEMTIEDKINSALVQPLADNAETAYLQGIGFERLGMGYSGHAMTAFKACIELERGGLLSADAKKHLIEIFKKCQLPIPSDMQEK